jgi:RimJ/RimL family protein N-acetyltransferase
MVVAISDKLCIRDLERGDAERLFHLMADPRVMEFLPDRFEDLAEMEEVLAWLIGNYGRPDFVRLTYKLEYESLFAGWISLGPLPSDETKMEVAYAVLPSLWGRGLASLALKAFLRVLVPTVHAGEVFAEVDEANLGSLKVLERNSFVRVGGFRSAEDGAKLVFRYERGAQNDDYR